MWKRECFSDSGSPLENACWSCLGSDARTPTWPSAPRTQTGLYWPVLFRWLGLQGEGGMSVCDYPGGGGGSWRREITRLKVL